MVVISKTMKKIILFTGAFVYLILMFICFAANAQQSSGIGPLVHIQTIKDFRGKISRRDSVFRLDTSEMHKRMMHRIAGRFRNDAAKNQIHNIRDNPDMSNQFNRHPGNGMKWNGIKMSMLKQADSISIVRRFTVHGDSLIRESRRIVYLKPASGKNNKTADTLIRINVTIHKGIKPGDIPDTIDPGLLNQDLNGTHPAQGQSDLVLNNLNIYPNPSQGQTRISFSSNENAPVGLKITDMEGKSVWQDASSDFNGSYDKTVDLSHQPKGIYILEISQNNKTTLKKLVIN